MGADWASSLAYDMPAKDLYHETVRRAIAKDGWRVTHDPLRLGWGRRSLYVDLGAERMLAAEKEGQKIAVEVKGFTGPSAVADLEQALGQYVLYQNVLARVEQDRTLYLAVRRQTFRTIFEEPLGELLIEAGMRLLVFNSETEEVVRWIP